MTDKVMTKRAEELLDGVRVALAADGYTLRLDDLQADGAHVSVAAGPDACSDCLAPVGVMRGIILETLKPLGVHRLTVDYPSDGAESVG
jgi:hypothetical protein